MCRCTEHCCRLSLLCYCRGAKRVAVQGAGDKRNYTANLFCTAAGESGPAQLIFDGKKMVPKKPSREQYPDIASYLYSLSLNHWANVRTQVRWVKDLLVPWLLKVGAVPPFM